MKKLITLLTFSFCFALYSFGWIGNSFVVFDGTWYTASHSYEQPAGIFQGAELGTFTTSFTLGGEAQIYPATTDDAIMGYKIVQNGTAVADSEKTLNLPRTGTSGDNSTHQSLAGATVSVADLAAGTYELHIWFNYGTDYDSNNSNNYVATFIVTKAPVVTLSAPSKVFLDEEIELSVSSDNIETPVYTYTVKVPESDEYVSVSSPYQPTVAGTYSFKVEAAASADQGTILATDEKEVLVKIVPEPITIHVKIPAEWTEVSFYNWNDDVTGNFITPSLVEYWYVYRFERMESVNIIFVNGTAWPDDTDEDTRLGKQTVNIENITVSTCYQVGDVSAADNGKRTVNVASCSGEGTGLVGVESATSVVAGNNQIQAAFDGKKQIQLYSVTGHQLYSGNAENQFTYPVSAGIYLLRIDGESHKVLVQ